MFHIHAVKDETKITVFCEQKNTHALIFEIYFPTKD